LAAITDLATVADVLDGLAELGAGVALQFVIDVMLSGLPRWRAVPADVLGSSAGIEWVDAPSGETQARMLRRRHVAQAARLIKRARGNALTAWF